MKPLDLLERLYDALRSERGVVIETEDPEKLRQRAYALRRDNMTEFGRLSFIISPTNPTRHLWILKKPETSREEL